MDPELLPRSGTRKIQSWIRNKSFRNHNTDEKSLGLAQNDEIKDGLTKNFKANSIGKFLRPFKCLVSFIEKAFCVDVNDIADLLLL